MASSSARFARHSRLRPIVALTMASGVALGGLAVTSPLNPALADWDGGSSAGRFVRGVGAETPGKGFWLGAYAPPGNVEQGYPAWCTHMWRANPKPSDNADISTLTDAAMWGPDELDLTTPQAAWLLKEHQADTSANNRAALSFLMHANFEHAQAGKDTQNSVNRLVDAVRDQLPDVYGLAEQYVRDAKNSAAVGYENGQVDGDGKREGNIHNIGIPNGNGGWIPGIAATITLNGPAVFKETKTNVWSGTTADHPITLEWEATGNGEVNHKGDYAYNVRRTLTKYGVNGKIQDTLSYGNRPPEDPEVTTINGNTWRVIFDFQPQAISNVNKGKVSDGSVLSDTLTASAVPSYGDGRWLVVDGKPVPVTFEGTAYYTGEEPASESDVVPADAVEVGKTTLTFAGEGTQTATITPTEELKPGFVTWVWKVVKNNQGENAKYVHQDWQDKYSLADETTSVPHIAEINTAASVRKTAGGDYLVDDVFVSGLPDNHGDWGGSHGFDADVATLDQSLLFFPKGLDVKEANKAQAEKIASVSVPAKNGFYPSVGSTKFKLKAGESGTYVFVTSFAGDSRVRAYTSSVEDVTEQYTTDVPEPTPGVQTTASDKADGDKEIAPYGTQTITDKVCYTNLIPGKEYTLSATLMDKDSNAAIKDANGREVTASKTFTATRAEGCEDVDIQVDGSLLAGKTTVVFEDLFKDGKRVGFHADITDEGQTVTSPGPKVGTTATDKADGDKEIAPYGSQTITDKVCYTNLIPGKEYALDGVLMDKATGDKLLIDGKAVTSSRTFTPESSKGCVDVEFTFDGSSLASRKVVVFEKVMDAGREVAVHADITDEGQTVTFETPGKPNPKLGKTGADMSVVAGSLIALATGGVLVAGERRRRNAYVARH